MASSKAAVAVAIAVWARTRPPARYVPELVTVTVVVIVVGGAVTVSVWVVETVPVDRCVTVWVDPPLLLLLPTSTPPNTPSTRQATAALISTATCADDHPPPEPREG
jgi:hypothetical protein